VLDPQLLDGCADSVTARGRRRRHSQAGPQEAVADGKAHGTDIFNKDPAYADQLARWIASQLKGSPSSR